MTLSGFRFRSGRAAVPAAVLASILGLGSAAAAGRTAAPSSSSNILLITIDTLRPDRLSCYGSKFLKTPAVDGLAERGVVFERAFAHASITLSSHANILLGTTPPFHGVSDNSKNKVREEFLTLAEHLRAAGFATGAFVGAFPLDSRFGLDQGFDVYDDLFPSRSPNPALYSERKAEDVLAAAKAWISGRTGKWFCWIHLFDPHAPYQAPEPYGGRFQNDPYSGEAAYVDAALGSFFAFLKSRGIENRTLTVLTADHGESLGEHGEMTHSFFAYNSTIHVPLIIAGPGIPAMRTPLQAGHIDLFPTICRFLGVSAPPGLQGRPLQPVWEGKSFPARPIYFEALDAHLNSGCAPLRGYIEGGVKFMDSPLPELYDLEKDFDETEDSAPRTDLAACRKKMNDLRASLSAGAPSPKSGSVDRETRERLRSLGYLVGSGKSSKTTFTINDDLKRFLPFQQKLEKANVTVREGGTAAAIVLYEELIRDRKDFISAYTSLAQTLIGAGRIEDALGVLDAGYRANPENYEILTAYGTVLIQAGRPDPAIGLLEKALLIIEDDPEVWDNLGLIYYAKRDYAKGEECYRKAIALDPTFAFAYSNLGILFITRNSGPNRRPDDLAEGLASLNKAVALDPTMNLAFRAQGIVLKASGKTAEAAAAWEKAIALDPEDKFSALSLATACLELGRKDRARAILEGLLKTFSAVLSPEDLARARAMLEQSRKDMEESCTPSATFVSFL